MEEKEPLPNAEGDSGKVDFAKKWLIVCIVLFVILIVLAIVLQFIPHDEEIWTGGSLPSSLSNK